MISLDESAPGFEVPGAEYCFLDIAREPVLILEKIIRNTVFRLYRDGKRGIPALQEQRHKTADCSCCELSLRNAIEARAFTSVCYPRKFMMANLVSETYADNLDFLNQANMRYLNPSIVFFGKLSTINTSIPKMARRQSLAKLEREAPHPYLPWGAEVDYQQRPDVLRALLLQVYRKDKSCFYKSLPVSDKHDKSSLEDWPRFYSKEEQQQTTESRLAGWTNYVSMDSILANSVHVAPWWGTVLCSWCGGIVVMSGIQDVIGHIVLVHRVLQEGVFSCPTCLGVSIVTWKSWDSHWRQHHAAASACLIVLNETACHARYAWGIGLSAVVAMTNLMNIDMPSHSDGGEIETHVTAYGGFAPGSVKRRALMKAIKEKQEELLPESMREVKAKPQEASQAGFIPIAAARAKAFPSFKGKQGSSQSRAGTPSVSRAATPKQGDTHMKRKAETYMPPPSPYDPNKSGKSAILKPTPTYQLPAYVPGPTYAPSGASTMELDFLNTPRQGPSPAWPGPSGSASEYRDELEDQIDAMPSDPAYAKAQAQAQAADMILDHTGSEKSEEEEPNESLLDKGESDDECMDNL
jgi:hypothetical protein